MNKVLLLIFAVGFSISGYAQTDLFSTFNSTYSGRSISLGASKTFGGKNELGLGLRYNFGVAGKAPYDLYAKSLYPKDFAEHWGLELFYNRYLTDKWECAKPFAFYDFQITHSQLHRANRDGSVEYFGPFTWVEQYIGIGLKIKLHKRLYLYQKLGAGMTLIAGEDEKYVTKPKMDWELAGLIQAGLVFRLRE